MAISRILHMKQAKSGYMAKHLANALKYIMDPEKTQDGRYVGSINCGKETALAQMIDTKRHYGKPDKRQGYHIIISFEETDVSADIVYEIMGKFADEYLKDAFEAVYAVHDDTDHMHAHLVFNSVCCKDGYKYDYKKGDWEKYIQPLVNRLCEEYQLGVLDLDKVREKRCREQTGLAEGEKVKKKALSERNRRIKQDVDRAVREADTYEEFQELLKHMGYDLRGKKHLAVREAGAQRHRRIDDFGEEYAEEMLRFRIERPPVPEISGSEIREKEAALIYVFVPYRNRHLTRHQRECFIRKYRAGKIHGNPKLWKYKANLQILRQLQEEYLFLVDYGITRKDQLEERQSILDQRLYDIGKESRAFMLEKSRYQVVLDTLKELRTARSEADLYAVEGYFEFEAEYRHYLQLEEQIHKLGFSAVQAENLDSYFQNESERIRDLRKEILRERRIAARLHEKVFSKDYQKEMGIRQKKTMKIK